MTEVETFFKPEPITCGCGCGKTGQPRVRPWRDGTLCVKRGCRCRRCTGRRSKDNGRRDQANAANLLGIPRSALHPGHEEFMGGPIRFEHKGGKSDAGPVFTRYEASKAQSDNNKSVGDNRPFVATFSQGKQVLAVFELEDGPQVVAALAEAFGMVP